jgi:tRNA modification GTPase
VAYDTHDTIAAIGSAADGAARSIVRLSGPATLECLAACFTADERVEWRDVYQPRRIAGLVRVAGDAKSPPLAVPGHVFVWPGARSYTREPAAEFHACGSLPLAAAVLDELCRRGARPAEPGEFTLRAFLAGRIDLTQAEGVLGVVDARGREDLDSALNQLAGGLSRPLHELRERLLGALAELEAGLDFADEPIEFIGREELRGRIEEGRRVIAATIAQLSGRERSGDTPRVVLVGAPNVGKSSLFNALVERFGEAGAVGSLVSSTPGATRDYVSAQIVLNGLRCELIDAAGDDLEAIDPVQQAAQCTTAAQRSQADVRVMCVERARQGADDPLVVVMKCDLNPPVTQSLGDTWRAGSVSPLPDQLSMHPGRGLTPPACLERIRCSSVTGLGLDELAVAIRRRIEEIPDEGRGVAAGAAARCSGSLREADLAMAAAVELSRGGGDELLAAEIRAAINAIGEVVGAVCADDVLDRIFSQFCIGK